MDRGFVHHQAVARMWAAVASQLADSTILPFDIRAYAIFLNRSLASLESSYGALLQQNNNSFGLNFYPFFTDESLIRIF